jgi:hypothetical protein
MEMEFMVLTCPSCGGNIQQVGQSNRWRCAHCGTEHILQLVTPSLEESSSPPKTLSTLRKEVREIQMEIVLAVGQFTSLYPDWQVSRWIESEKGEGGELGAYRGRFLEELIRRLLSEVIEKKSGIWAYTKAVSDGKILAEKLIRLRNDIAVKKRLIQARKETRDVSP